MFNVLKDMAQAGVFMWDSIKNGDSDQQAVCKWAEEEESIQGDEDQAEALRAVEESLEYQVAESPAAKRLRRREEIQEIEEAKSSDSNESTKDESMEEAPIKKTKEWKLVQLGSGTNTSTQLDIAKSTYE